MNNFPLKTVYLAGPISGLSYEQARHGWREQFQSILATLPGKDASHIHLLSPMRAKDFLLKQVSLDGAPGSYEQHPLSRDIGIIGRDYNDVRNCDVMLANFLEADRVSIGTVWEFGAAYAHQKVIIAVVPEENHPHNHVFIKGTAKYVVHDLLTAAQIVYTLCTPGI